MKRLGHNHLSVARLNQAADLAVAFGFRVADSDDEYIVLDGSTTDGVEFTVGPTLFLDEPPQHGWGVWLLLPEFEGGEFVAGRRSDATCGESLLLSMAVHRLLESVEFGPVPGPDKTVEEIASDLLRPVREHLGALDLHDMYWGASRFLSDPASSG